MDSNCDGASIGSHKGAQVFPLKKGTKLLAPSVRGTCAHQL